MIFLIFLIIFPLVRKVSFQRALINSFETHTRDIQLIKIIKIIE